MLELGSEAVGTDCEIVDVDLFASSDPFEALVVRHLVGPLDCLEPCVDQRAVFLVAGRFGFEDVGDIGQRGPFEPGRGSSAPATSPGSGDRVELQIKREFDDVDWGSPRLLKAVAMIRSYNWVIYILYTVIGVRRSSSHSNYR